MGDWSSDVCSSDLHDVMMNHTYDAMMIIIMNHVHDAMMIIMIHAHDAIMIHVHDAKMKYMYDAMIICPNECPKSRQNMDHWEP
jgi:hypothetical protein